MMNTPSSGMPPFDFRARAKKMMQVLAAHEIVEGNVDLALAYSTDGELDPHEGMKLAFMTLVNLRHYACAAETDIDKLWAESAEHVREDLNEDLGFNSDQGGDDEPVAD